MQCLPFQFLRGFPSAATSRPDSTPMSVVKCFNSFAAFHPLQPDSLRPAPSRQIVRVSIPSRLSIRCNVPKRTIARFKPDVSIPSRLSIRCNPHLSSRRPRGGRSFNSFAAFHPLQLVVTVCRRAVLFVSIPSRLSIRCNYRRPPEKSCLRTGFNSFAAFHPLQRFSAHSTTFSAASFQFLRGFPSAATRQQMLGNTSRPRFNSFAAFHPLQLIEDRAHSDEFEFQFLRGFPSAAT